MIRYIRQVLGSECREALDEPAGETCWMQQASVQSIPQLLFVDAEPAVGLRRARSQVVVDEHLSFLHGEFEELAPLREEGWFLIFVLHVRRESGARRLLDSGLAEAGARARGNGAASPTTW